MLIDRPTSEFPHPMARVPQPAAYWVCYQFLLLKNIFPVILLIPVKTLFVFCTFQLSYILVDLLVWWGIRGYINDFRKKKLNLPPIAYFSTYHGSISHFPTGYMWSPHVVPKPKGICQLLNGIWMLVFVVLVIPLLLLKQN